MLNMIDYYPRLRQLKARREKVESIKAGIGLVLCLAVWYAVIIII